MCDFASLARGSIKTRTGEALSSSPRDRFAQARLATKPLHSPVVAPQTWNDDDSLLLGFGLLKPQPGGPFCPIPGSLCTSVLHLSIGKRSRISMN